MLNKKRTLVLISLFFVLTTATSLLFAETQAIQENTAQERSTLVGLFSLADLVDKSSPAVVRIAIKGKVRSQQNPLMTHFLSAFLDSHKCLERENLVVAVLV